MIRSFRHKGLEKYFLKGTKSGIQAKHVPRLRLILGRLNAATNPKDMDLPGLQLHELRGKKKGVWSVGSVETGALRSTLMVKMPNWLTTKIIIEV